MLQFYTSAAALVVQLPVMLYHHAASWLSNAFLLNAPRGSALRRLASLMMRLDDLSHILAWSEAPRCSHAVARLVGGYQGATL